MRFLRRSDKGPGIDRMEGPAAKPRILKGGKGSLSADTWAVHSMVDGSEYQGWLRHGIRHGKGLHTSEDGSFYDGHFRDDMPHGDGWAEWQESGYKYHGQWKSGLYHGHGLLSHGNGWIYNGQFREGMQWGRGRCEWAKKNQNPPVFQWYVGTWRDGLEHGFGESGLTLSDTRFVKQCGVPELSQKGQICIMDSGTHLETLRPIRVLPTFDGTDEVHRIGLGEASRNPAAWLRSVKDASRNLEAPNDLDDLVLEARNDSLECVIPKWGFSIGRPESWIPGLWGALLLTRIDLSGELADWNEAAKEAGQRDAVEINAIVWRVDGVGNDTNRMLAMLLDKTREGIVLELRNPEDAPEERGGSSNAW